MIDDPRSAEGLIASRLDHLFRTVHPKDRGPYSPADVADAINGAAGENVISPTYVWQLRTGRRDNPTYRHLITLSRFFGVSPTYFFDPAEVARGSLPDDVVLALADNHVRDIALRAAGLSDRSLKAIRELVDSARAIERLQPRSRLSSQYEIDGIV